MFATYSSTTFFWRESEMTLGIVRDCFKGFRIWTAYVYFPLTSAASCISRDLFLRLKLISPASAIQTDHPKLLPFRRRRLRHNSDSAPNHANWYLWELLICDVTGANDLYFAAFGVALARWQMVWGTETVSGVWESNHGVTVHER